MHQYTDTELVLSVRTGDVKAFELLFERYCRMLVRYAATILKDRDDAEDVVQHLFVGLWTKKAELDVNVSMRSYLYTAVYNSSINRIKGRQVRESHAEHTRHTTSPSISAAQQLEAKEVEDAIREAIAELPEQCRIIFSMSRFEELKYQEIADQLGLSIKTVENQMGKALKHMRGRLQNYLNISIVFWLINQVNS